MSHRYQPQQKQPRPRRYRSLIGHRAAPHLRPSPAPAPPAATAPPAAEEQRQAELEQELQLARDIQQGILLAAVPFVPGWEMSTVSAPARDLGGDLYDFLELPDGRLGLMIGDVSGKGLPAALRMAVARTVFRHEARRGESAARTLEAVNRVICSDIPHGMITMIYMQLDPQHGTLQIANAGHTYPFVLDGSVYELEISGLPLGVLDESEYDEVTMTVPPGGSILLYTDGVTEATNAHEELFGEAHLLDLLTTHTSLKPSAMQRMLLREVRSWSPVQDDDITMVLLRRRLASLRDEVRSIVVDVLGEPAASEFWQQQVARLPVLHAPDAPLAAWAEVPAELGAAARSAFGRGIARELQQQIRLAFEGYRDHEHDRP